MHYYWHPIRCAFGNRAKQLDHPIVPRIRRKAPGATRATDPDLHANLRKAGC